MTWGRDSSGYAKLTDEQRAATAESTGGEPVYDLRGDTSEQTTTYIEYVATDVLHSLQKVRSKEPDEMTFLVIGQVMELLFNLTQSELKRCQAALRANDVALATLILSRVQRVLEYLTQSWDVICTLTPSGYVGFRDHLGRASGFGSHMYRHVEFVLGNKLERMLKLHVPTPAIHAALKADFDAPSLYDDVIALLHRRGFAIDAACIDRDWSKPHEPNESVQAAWLEIYRSGEVSAELYRLGEALMALAERFKSFRFRHFVSVERLIGSKPGTGGTSGLGWLRLVIDQNFFPELWSVRTIL